jgi:hypothetical protein
MVVPDLQFEDPFSIYPFLSIHLVVKKMKNGAPFLSILFRFQNCKNLPTTTSYMNRARVFN